MSAEEEVRAALHRFVYAGLIEIDLEKVKKCLGSQIIGIGIGEQGFVTSWSDVQQVLEAGQKEENTAQHSLEYERVEILVQRECFAVVSAEINIISKQLDNSTVSRSKLFQSLSLIKEEGEWKICGLHASTPVITEEVLDAYPLKFAEKTLQSLREKIGEKAYLAEEQYRQAVLADTIAFYIINFTQNQFEKTQLNGEWCVYVEPKTPYQGFLLEKAPYYLDEEDKILYLESFCIENIKRAFENSQKEICCEYRMRLPDGSHMWVLSILRLINDINTGEQKGIMYVKNIDQSKREEMNMRSRANHDQMTGVFNKGMMTQHVCEQTAKTGGIFIMLDVDDFKTINDTFGHPIGDQALIAVANELKNSYHIDGTEIGRMGGDEFSVFIPCTKLDKQTEEELIKLRERFTRIRIVSEPSLRLTCSIGAVYFPQNTDFESVYQKADNALYLAKRRGKNRVVFLTI